MGEPEEVAAVELDGADAGVAVDVGEAVAAPDEVDADVVVGGADAGGGSVAGD